MNESVSRPANSARFLAAFSRIESHLRRHLKAEVRVSFNELLHQSMRHDRWLERFSQDLVEFAELRNAIVHRFRPERALAEPTDEATAWIERMAGALTTPPSAGTRFRRKVITVERGTAVGVAVRAMRSHEFSKLPVLAGAQVTALLTTGTIARWLGSEADNGLVDLEATSVGAVLLHAEEPQPYRIASATASVFDAVSLFLEQQDRGHRLEAVLITENGRPSGRLVGLVTTSDLPAAIRDLLPAPARS